MLLNAGEEERTHGSKAAYIAGFPGQPPSSVLLSFVFLTNGKAFGSTDITSHLTHAR